VTQPLTDGNTFRFGQQLAREFGQQWLAMVALEAKLLDEAKTRTDREQECTVVYNQR
jgi:hypothetical protein